MGQLGNKGTWYITKGKEKLENILDTFILFKENRRHRKVFLSQCRQL